MAAYKTPGVYIEEISTLPPSVAEVSTAIPAFIGYTEKGSGIARIDTLLEYEATFGNAQPKTFDVKTKVNTDTGLDEIEQISPSNGGTGSSDFLLYYCVSHYFKNGGGSCYVISIGNYDATPAKADFENGLGLLEKEDEPTLILLTDAVNLDAADYYDVCQQALAQCKKLGDRFTILDVQGGEENVADFRNRIGTADLMYGAAYLPYLNTTLNYRYKEADISIEREGAEEGTDSPLEFSSGTNGIIVRYIGTELAAPKVKIISGEAGLAVEFVIETDVLTIRNVDGKTGVEVVSAWDTWAAANDAQGFEVAVDGDGSVEVQHTNNRNMDLERRADAAASQALSATKSNQTALYNLVKAEMTKQRVVLPPSAAIAGIYARVDRERGVWKAPANVSISAVIGPVSKVTHEEQAQLNVDPTAGKSINAIREFTGKGTLVWGARTLAGNDNEWRYVSVRRLFNMIEESTKKATAFAVFEPNDATTWLKVKGMIESYLYGLWERGALAGSTPEAAYFVNVGLGKTMTAQDILEGRMIVEIGVAAVRPAEFIIIRFTHKLQEA